MSVRISTLTTATARTWPGTAGLENAVGALRGVPPTGEEAGGTLMSTPGIGG